MHLIVAILVACLASVQAVTDCEHYLHGHCLSIFGGSSGCPSGYHMTLNYCGFLQECCYSTSALHPHTTHAPTNSPVTASHGGTTSHGQCGVPAVQGNHKIVGGTVADHGEYPWQVSLRYHGSHMCGGTLIDNQWVVTAAHCFEDTNPRYWTIGVGLHDQGHVYTSQVHHERQILVHAHYDKNRNHNDIAMVKLDQPVDLNNQYIKAACLPAANANYDNQMCTVTGWGALHSGGHGSRYLEEVDVPVMTNSVCRYYLGNVIYTSNICAGYAQGGKDACQGDSGGPLVCKKNGAWELAGVVSWGYGCAQKNAPGVYTRVSSFLDWIDNVRQNH